MGKIKVKRKSTLIDMTAMSDVTVLLLTFFMLTSTFLQKEPTQVITPPSVSEEKVETSNVAQILIAPVKDTENRANPNAIVDTRVFISLLGEADTVGHQDWASEPLRKTVLRNAIQLFADRSGHQVQLTEGQVESFAKLTSFGVPMAYLSEFLSLDQTKQDEWLSNMEKPQNGEPVKNGIPTKTVKGAKGEYNEFEIWMTAIRDAGNGNLTEAMRKTGSGIAIKTDQETPFHMVREVLELLRNIKLNKFTVMTSLKTESD